MHRSSVRSSLLPPPFAITGDNRRLHAPLSISSRIAFFSLPVPVRAVANLLTRLSCR
jgi:hypothetical protein